MNLLKALNAIDAAQKPAAAADNTKPAPEKTESAAAPAPEYEYPNVMQSVLVRHEQISNRVKNQGNKQ